MRNLDAKLKHAFIGTAAPSFYRFRLGDAEATIISDGAMDIGAPEGSFIGPTSLEIDYLLDAHFMHSSRILIEQNILVLNTGNQLVLFDTGLGPIKQWGDAGKLLTNLRQAGISPEDIDAVVISHAHIDHCGGIMSEDGTRNFPNAEYYMSESDYHFWTDFQRATPSSRVFIEAARRNLLPNRERFSFFSHEQEFLPGIQAISAPGHTVGHTIFMISSGNELLCHIADLAHHSVLHLQRPQTEFAHDTDPKQAVETRVRVLSWLAANRIPILGYHFMWPGLGYVARQDEGFRYIPRAMQLDYLRNA